MSVAALCLAWSCRSAQFGYDNSIGPARVSSPPLVVRRGCWMAPLRLVVLLGLSVIVLSPQFCLAQTADTGRKTVTIYAGGPVGGGVDLYARLVARHLGRHLSDSPSVVVSNMPGAGSISCANF